MKYTRKIVVNDYELVEAVAMQYGLPTPGLDLVKLFWADDCNSNCCKTLDLSDADLYIDEVNNSGDTHALRCALILSYLRNVFPDENEILVRIS